MNEEIRAARAAAYPALKDRPRERRCGEDGAPTRVRSTISLVRTDAEERAATERNGLQVVHIRGVASVTESGYEMYDLFGPYTEVVTAGAFGKTLAAKPLVEFNVNHGKTGSGMPMAHTRNDTLDLNEDLAVGLLFDAFADPTRSDVSDLVKAMERGDQAEASFKFRITSGMWSPDYDEFRINEVDLNGGDVSSVNFGANPAASAGLARSAAPDLRLRLLDLGLATSR